jgi:hypothetical protein
MNDLEEKPREHSDTSRWSHRVSESSAALSNYINKRGDVTLDHFRPAGASDYDRSEQQPSMTISPIIAPPKPRTSKVTAGWAHYVAVALCISLAAREGVLLAASVYSGIRVEVQPATAQAERGAAVMAALASSTSPSGDENSKPKAIAPAQPSLTQGNSWSEAVKSFQQLLAWEARAQ